MRYLFFVTAFSLVAIGAAAQEPKLALPDVSDFKLDRDLSSYRTFAWNRSQVPAENMANHLRIINAIQDEMKERGYRVDPVNPQIRIQYRLDVTSRARGRTSQQRSVWDDANATVQIDFDTQTEAAFGLEFVDAESNIMVWQSKGNYVLGTADRAGKQITEAVADLFEKYPEPE